MTGEPKGREHAWQELPSSAGFSDLSLVAAVQDDASAGGPLPVRYRRHQSLRLTDPLSPFGFLRQPRRLRTVLPRERGCPHHSGP